MTRAGFDGGRRALSRGRPLVPPAPVAWAAVVLVLALGLSVATAFDWARGPEGVVPTRPNDLSDEELGESFDEARATDALLEATAQSAATAGQHDTSELAPDAKPGTQRIAHARRLRQKKMRRKIRAGGMLRRYAPELFGDDVYGADDNDNVNLAARASIFDAMNGPFAPMPRPSDMRPAPNGAAVRRALLLEHKAHAYLDAKEGLRHRDDFDPKDPYATTFTYVPKGHRTRPFGFARFVSRVRRDQALDIGPFDQMRYAGTYANPLNAFMMKRTSLPIPFNPRLPFADGEAAIQGMRPSKLQEFPDFVPPPHWPAFAPPPPEEAKKD